MFKKVGSGPKRPDVQSSTFKAQCLLAEQISDPAVNVIKLYTYVNATLLRICDGDSQIGLS